MPRHLFWSVCHTCLLKPFASAFSAGPNIHKTFSHFPCFKSSVLQAHFVAKPSPARLVCSQADPSSLSWSQSRPEYQECLRRRSASCLLSGKKSIQFTYIYRMPVCLFTKLRHHLLKWQTLLARTSTERTLLCVKIVLQLSSDHRSLRKKAERSAERLANPPSGPSFQDWRHRTPGTATNRSSQL